MAEVSDSHWHSGARGTETAQKRAGIPRDWEPSAGVEARATKCQHRFQAREAERKCDERDRPQDHLCHAGDCGTADHLAIFRVALIVGTQANDRVPRCAFPM
jgi:hypothetical protein